MKLTHNLVKYRQLEQMLRNVKRRKATPGNGFIKMKIAEKLAQLKTEDK